MTLRSLAPLVLLILVAGCIVVHDDPPPRRVVYTNAPPPPPPASTTVVVTEEDEVHYVVYREYFGCTEEEIYVLPHYRRYYACTDDDFYFCFFIARCRGISFDVCWRSYYYDCGRSCDRLIVYYNVPRERFFVAVGPGVTYPPVYHNTYVWYNSGARTNVTFTNTECVALVHMKVGCEYQGHPPTTYFAKVQANNGNTSRVIVQSRENCGNGGKSVTGAAVQKTAPRPWTMPPQQKQAWHQQHQTQVMKTETTFKEVHKEQVQKVQQQEHQQPQHPQQHQNTQKPPPGGKGVDEHPQQGQGQGKPGPQGNEPGHKGQVEPGQKPPPGKGEGQPPPKGQHEEKHNEGGKGKGGEEEKGKKGDK